MFNQKVSAQRKISCPVWAGPQISTVHSEYPPYQCSSIITEALGRYIYPKLLWVICHYDNKVLSQQRQREQQNFGLRIGRLWQGKYITWWKFVNALIITCYPVFVGLCTLHTDVTPWPCVTRPPQNGHSTSPITGQQSSLETNIHSV